jgi:Tfp pilus assembly protein PilF
MNSRTSERPEGASSTRPPKLAPDPNARRLPVVAADDPLAGLLAAAVDLPSDATPEAWTSAWDALEEAAAEAQRPELVLDAALALLQDPHASATLVEELGRRAVRFHDEWFDAGERLTAILGAILIGAPAATWAFERLVLALTVAARWSELLAAYDRALEGASDDPARRAHLLDEAAHVAKDFAGAPDRAIGYLQQLLPLRPTDAQLATSLERLLERQGRFAELIDLWTTRLSFLPRDGKLATRARIAACHLDRLGRPEDALATCETLLAEDPHDSAGCRILERLALLDAPAVKGRAIALLHERYSSTKRSADVVRVLEIALAGAGDDDARRPIVRELVERLVELGRDDAAIEHAATLIRLAPSDLEARERLRTIAGRIGREDRRAEALAAAAEHAADGESRVDLLVEAGAIRADVLGDAAGAAGHLEAALALSACAGTTRLLVARRLEALHEALGRIEARLAVLEELADLEPDLAARREVLARAAGLASARGEVDRALRAWERRLATDPSDLEALDAIVDLLDRADRAEALVEALRRRLRSVEGNGPQRADLVRIATLEERKLDRIDAAIETWRSIETTFGPTVETTDTLARLFETADRAEELAAHLDLAAAREQDPKRKADLLQRLGDVDRDRLAEPSRAAMRYHDALAIEPNHAGARAGLRALLERGSHEVRIAAASTLATAYRKTDDWPALLEILEHRIAVAADAQAAADVLIEAAQIHERWSGDRAGALSALARAFPLVPADVALERELVRLAEETGVFTSAVDALAAAIGASEGDPLRVAALRIQLGTILETRVGDRERALAAYLPVLGTFPGSVEASESVVRVGGALGRWDQAAAAFVGFVRAEHRLDAAFALAFEQAAEVSEAWDAATTALEVVLGRSEGLSPAIARSLEALVGRFHRDRRQDPVRAEAAFERAVAADATDAETVRELAVLKRRHPDHGLLDTLLTLADATHDDLGTLFEAAQVALEVVADGARAAQILDRLLEAAAERWRSPHALPTLPPASAPARPSLAPGQDPLHDLSSDSFAAWALDRLVVLHVDGGEPARAIEVLVRGAQLPFEPAAARALLHRAAELATTHVGDPRRAIELYRRILAGARDDMRARGALASLYEGTGRFADLASLRREELDLATSPDDRRAIRIDLARVLVIQDDAEGALEVLRANLDERPGDDATIARIVELLEREEREADLANLLSEQALQLETTKHDEGAARLWTKVATLAETPLGDVPRALESWGRVVALAPTPTAFDALARLHAARSESAVAIAWLERRLAATPSGERAETVARLAEEHLRAGARAQALVVLETGLREEPGARILREALAALLREAEDWADLARLLEAGAARESEDPTRIDWLAEAAELHVRRLDDPAAAIPLLEEAVALAEKSESGAARIGGRDQVRLLRIALADALRLAGRLDDAKATCDDLVGWYGRRRPPERAQVHVQLAHLARARGDATEALQQLELASSMDLGSAEVLRALGELSWEAKDYPRAERAYRALLLVVRRSSVEATIGPSEVLFELHRIAAAQGQDDRARENLESAFEVASTNEAEGRRLVQLLRESGNEAFLVRALEARVAVESDPTAIAALLVELADALDALGRTEEALDARLDALAHVPDSVPLHAAVRDLARRAGRLDRYEQRLRALAERARERGELAPAASFLLRLGELVEHDLGDLPRAADVYAEAEALGGEPSTSALRALARIARAREDRDVELRALRALVQLDEQDPALRTESLYRLAELALGRADTRDEGIEILAWAVDREPQLDRALGLLRAAPDDAGVLALHERVARASGDPALLLEALERAASRERPSLAVLREAVDLAQKIEDPARGGRLLSRAIEIGREGGEPGEIGWALVALAGLRRSTGELGPAIDLLVEAADAAAEPDATDLRREAATIAVDAGDRARAAQILEVLRARDPGDRRVWEPLLGILRDLGDHGRLEGLIAETIENVFDAEERNVLRLERARLLLDRPGREDDAAAAFQEIVDDEPEQEEAARLLADLYERLGRTQALLALLRARFERALEGPEIEPAIEIGLRLGALLEESYRDEAIEVHARLAARAPEDRRLLQAQVRALRPTDDPAHRIAVLDRLLAVERGDEAAAVALELAQLRQANGDEAGAVATLEKGFLDAPTDGKLRLRLEKLLAQRGDHARLSEIVVIDARARRDKRATVLRLREAAKIRLEKLADPRGAAEILAEARALLPEDLGLLAELAAARAEAGAVEEAIREVTEVLDAQSQGARPGEAAKISLLRTRADLRRTAGELAAAVEDLEAAHALGGAAIAPELAAALERLRESTRDLDSERAIVRKLVALHGATGEVDAARAVLEAFARRDPNDPETFRALASIASSRGDDAGLVAAYGRLVDLETGAARAETALALADAAERGGDPEAARRPLERALEETPEDVRIRERLRRVYEASSSFSELAALTLIDARLAQDEGTRFELLLTVGDLYLRSVGEEAKAVEPLEEALRLRPHQHEATLLLADALTLAGEIDRAMELLLPAIDRHKGRRSKELAALQHRMARAANAGGGRDVELQWLSRALECDMQNGQIAAELAEVAIELRQWEIATKALKAVTLLRTPGPMSRALATLRQGQIAFHQGDPKRAALLAKKALSEEPTLTEAETFLRELGA